MPKINGTKIMALKRTIHRRIEPTPQLIRSHTSKRTTTIFMKTPISKFEAIVQTPVYPQTLHQFRPDPKAAATPKPPKRDNTFSKSRDMREDRGTREMKTSHNSQSFPHPK
jgi:hypothetical protein